MDFYKTWHKCIPKLDTCSVPHLGQRSRSQSWIIVMMSKCHVYYLTSTSINEFLSNMTHMFTNLRWNVMHHSNMFRLKVNFTMSNLSFGIRILCLLNNLHIFQYNYVFLLCTNVYLYDWCVMYHIYVGQRSRWKGKTLSLVSKCHIL